jgi:hypothetical protein
VYAQETAYVIKINLVNIIYYAISLLAYSCSCIFLNICTSVNFERGNFILRGTNLNKVKLQDEFGTKFMLVQPWTVDLD